MKTCNKCGKSNKNNNAFIHSDKICNHCFISEKRELWLISGIAWNVECVEPYCKKVGNAFEDFTFHNKGLNLSKRCKECIRLIDIGYKKQCRDSGRTFPKKSVLSKNRFIYKFNKLFGAKSVTKSNDLKSLSM